MKDCGGTIPEVIGGLKREKLGGPIQKVIERIKHEKLGRINPRSDRRAKA